MTVPTIQELNDAILADLEAELGVIIPESDKNYLKVQAAVQAARLKLGFLATAKVQQNIFADTAEYESQGGTLERFGRVKLNRSPYPALAGQYVVALTGTSGTVVPARTLFTSDDDSLSPGYRFVLDTAYTLGGTGNPTLRALTAGIESKLEVGDTLSLVSPIPLVNTTATVLSEPIPPQAAEDLEEYREKVLEAFRYEPQGGSGSDYRLWASNVQGVDEAYPFTAQVGDAVEVNLFIEAVVADSTDGFGTPSSTMLNAVRDEIELPSSTHPSRKPLTDAVNYLPVSPLPVLVRIIDLQNSTPSIETAILGQIRAFVRSVRPFVGSIDILSAKNDIISVNNLIGQVLIVAPGSVFTELELFVDSVQVSTFTFDNGNIPYVDDVIFA